MQVKICQTNFKLPHHFTGHTVMSFCGTNIILTARRLINELCEKVRM